MKKLALLLSLLAIGALGLTACGGGDDDGTAVASDTEATVGSGGGPVNPTDATLSRKQETEQQIERIGNKWAPLFAAAEPAACLWYMGGPEACDRIDCEHSDGQPIKNCTPLSPGLQKSFADATVQDVALKLFDSGAIAYLAGAKFSNGETVLFHGDGGGWMISKVGGNAGDREFLARLKGESTR